MGSVALITGSSGGIGRAIAQVFKGHGWCTVGLDLIPPADSSSLDVFMEVDLAAETFEQVAEKVRGRGDLGVLINNAAIQPLNEFSEFTARDWQRTFDVNVRAAALLSTALLPLLRAGTGSIVNIGSVHANVTSPGMAPYVASKGALVALTRAMALELAPEGIRVNAVLPGAIETPMLHSSLMRDNNSEQSRAQTESRTPLGRIGDPLDVAIAVYFLADPESAGFITGQSLTVDGGASVKLSSEG